MQMAILLAIARGLAIASPHPRGLVPPGIERDPPLGHGPQVCELPFGTHEIVAARADRHDLVDLRQLQRPVDPGAAIHRGGEADPVGMVVEVHDRDRRLDTAQQHRGDVMEITRAVEEDGHALSLAVTLAKALQQLGLGPAARDDAHGAGEVGGPDARGRAGVDAPAQRLLRRHATVEVDHAQAQDPSPLLRRWRRGRRAGRAARSRGRFRHSSWSMPARG